MCLGSDVRSANVRIHSRPRHMREPADRGLRASPRDMRLDMRLPPFDCVRGHLRNRVLHAAPTAGVP